VATRTVTVDNRAPTASFTVSPAAPVSGSAVTFASSSSDPDGTIASQAWDLDNDGAFDDGTAATATKTFATPGSYTVRLQVTDDNGTSAVASKTVTVGNRAPVASFGSSPASPSSGDPVTFTSTSTDPDGFVASQAWDLDNDGAFDDGTAATASRTFGATGSYTVRLQVTDDRGASSTTSQVVTVANRSPVAVFSVAPASPVTGAAVTFTSSSTDPDGTVASQAWDLDNDGAFDDGTAATASRSFAKAGTYTVRLQVTDNNGATNADSKTVTVANRSPVAAFTIAPAAPVTGATVTFTSSSSDPDGTIASQAWDLDNDGAYDDASTATASRSFAKAGTYTVGLQVTDDNGASATTAKTVTVANRAPVAAFTISPNPTSTGQQVTFDSTTSSDPDGTIASRAWDLDNDGAFDDGTAATASRSFATAGTYTVRLQVTDDNGASATKSATVTIDTRAPTAEFSFTPTTPATKADVTFTSTSSDPDGTIASQAWDLDNDGQFDDGTATTAVRSFAKRGTYTVRLKVTDNSNVSSIATHTVNVANRAPAAAFNVAPDTVITGEPTQLDAAASTDSDGSIKSYLWDLDGDGTFETDTGTTPETSRFYGEPGNVVVGLQVTDDDGAVSVTQRTITVEEAPPFADGPTVPPPDTDPLPGVDPTPDPGPSPDPTPQPKPGKPPRGSVRVLSHNLRAALRRGLPLRFSSNEAATARFAVMSGKRKIASKTKLVGAGRASLRLKLRSRPRGPVSVRLTLIDAGGLSKTYSVRAVLR
jgi:PKD repeat protein